MLLYKVKQVEILEILLNTNVIEAFVELGVDKFNVRLCEHDAWSCVSYLSWTNYLAGQMSRKHDCECRRHEQTRRDHPSQFCLFALHNLLEWHQ
jgi:hypothetical protein